jgi:hypothetical protein
MKYTAAEEQALMTEIWDPAIAEDPYRFVMFVYPWGKKGTPLETFTGPRSWQREYLKALGEHIQANKARMAEGEQPQMWRHGTVSGRGPGKSALVAWRSHWMMSTNLGSTTVITANTEPQLKSRTFAEVTKWLTLAINGHWFDSSVLSVRPAKWFEKLLKDQLNIDTGYYYSQGQLWSEENPDAFAGAHNPLGFQVIYDEASGIPQPIWNVTEGFFTEPVLHRYWDVFSNGRRNSGAFFDMFNSPETAKRWRHLQVDSRTVEGTDKALFESMVEQYGIDSDVVRVEVLGQFPKQGDRQFISNAVVQGAQQRELVPDIGAPLVMGVDVARYGDDFTVIRWRQGRDGRTYPPVKAKGLDNMEVAKLVAHWIDKTAPDAVCIDAGNGTGVIDRLKEMKYRVHEVWFGSKSSDKQWANKRTEMYADVRDWLGGGAIDRDPELFRDLTSPEYDFFGKAKDALMLESKESMKSRGLHSPDDGDALALTFAVKVARRDMRSGSAGRRRVAADVDYSVFG